MAGQKRQRSSKSVDGDGFQTGLTAYELERLEIIQRNRERLIALGLPALVGQLQVLAAPAPKPKKPRVKKEPWEHAKRETGGEEGAVPGAPRRSSRLREAVGRPKPETAEERLERELGEFVVDGECPRCGRIFERAHRAHLVSCAGPPQPSALAGYSARDKELLSELTEAERKDERKRTLARTKALELSGLVDYAPEAAKFVVIGSKGNPYTVTLADAKHTCTCLDYRFRRHHCKHICLVLQQLGILEEPTSWYVAVGEQLDELARAGAGAGSQYPETVPRDKDAEMAMKFV